MGGGGGGLVLNSLHCRGIAQHRQRCHYRARCNYRALANSTHRKFAEPCVGGVGGHSSKLRRTHVQLSRT